MKKEKCIIINYSSKKKSKYDEYRITKYRIQRKLAR